MFLFEDGGDGIVVAWRDSFDTAIDRASSSWGPCGSILDFERIPASDVG